MRARWIRRRGLAAEEMQKLGGRPEQVADEVPSFYIGGDGKEIECRSAGILVDHSMSCG
jgi:hypothetical protein